MGSKVKTHKPGDRPGKILLVVGIALTLFSFSAAFLTITHGPEFHGLLKAGMGLLGVYALVGAATALILGVRRGKKYGRPKA